MKHRKLNILQISGSFFPSIGGQEIVVHNLSNALVDDGHNVYVMVSYTSKRNSNNINKKYHLLSYGIPGHVFFNIKIPIAVLQILFAIKKYNIDIICIHNLWWPGRIIPFLKFFVSKIPVIGIAHGRDIQTDKSINYGVRLNSRNDKLVKRNLNYCDAIVALSNTIRKDIIDCNINEQRIYSIPNGIWTSLFLYNKKRLISRKDKFRIISVGGNRKEKGFYIIPQLINKLQKNFSDFEYILVGGNMQNIEYEAEKFGVGKYLKTTGILKQIELASLYTECDLYISTSLIESFGITTLEAMCSGLPCLVSNVSGNKDLVDKDFGFTYSLGDINEIVSKIIYLIENPDIRRAMGNIAKVKAQQYNWDNIALKYEDLFYSLLDM